MIQGALAVVGVASLVSWLWPRRKGPAGIATPAATSDGYLRFPVLFVGQGTLTVDAATGARMVRAMASQQRSSILTLAEELRSQQPQAAQYLWTFATYHLPPVQV